MFGEVFCLRRKADAPRAVLQCCDISENVWVSSEFKLRGITGSGFLEFLITAIDHVPVSHSSHSNEYVGVLSMLHHGPMHLARALNIDALHAIRGGQGSGSTDQYDFSTGFPRRARNRKSGFPGAAVGDYTHRINTFGCWSCCDQDAAAGKTIRLKKCDQFGKNL